MNKPRIAAAAAAVLLLAGCTDDDPDIGPGGSQPPTYSTPDDGGGGDEPANDDDSDPATDNTTDDGGPDDVEAHEHSEPDDATVPDDLSTVDRTDPNQVATWFGCGYYVHELGDSPEDAANRLAPLATDQMTAEIANLSRNGLEGIQVRVELGSAQQFPDEPGWWKVICPTLWLEHRDDGTVAPIENASGPSILDVHLTETGDGWTVDQARIPAQDDFTVEDD